MKKITSLVVAVLCASAVTFAQESTFNVGDKVVNLGIGLGSSYYTGTYYHTAVPPVSVSGEYGVKDRILEKGSIGIGGVLAFSSYKWKYSNDWYYTYSNVIFGVRGAFHYPLVDKLDTYTGLTLGYWIASYKEHGTNLYGYDYSTSGSHPLFAWYAGARYYFNDKFAGMAEIGYGISYLTLGLAIKL
jgi:hypothetical protein